MIYFFPAEPSKIFCSFSLYTTLKGLFGPVPDEWPAGIDGARVIALAVVILHNTLDLSTPIVNDSEDGHVSFISVNLAKQHKNCTSSPTSCDTCWE